MGYSTMAEAESGSMNAVVGLLRDAFAAPSNAVVVVENSARITFASAAAAVLLGSSESSLIGRNLRGFLHESHAQLLDRLPLTRATYEDIQIVDDSGVLVTADITVVAISDLGVDAHVLTIQASGAEDEQQLRDELVVEQYCHSLNLDLITSTSSEQLTTRVARACKEVGELTNSHTVTLTLDWREREEMEAIGRWVHPDCSDTAILPPLRRSAWPRWREAVLSRSFVVDDIHQPPFDQRTALHLVPALGAFITVPLKVGEIRGVFILTRRSGPHRWRSFDRRLAQATSTILGAALRRSHIEQLWKMACELGPIGLSVRTTAGQLVECNPQYLALYGLSPDELAAADLLDRIHPDDRDGVSVALEVAQGDEPVPMTYHLRALQPDGEFRYLQTTTIVVPVAGRVEPLRLTATHEIPTPAPPS